MCELNFSFAMNGRQEEHLACGLVRGIRAREFDPLSLRSRPPLRDSICQPCVGSVHLIKREKLQLQSELKHLRLETAAKDEQLRNSQKKYQALSAQNALVRKEMQGQPDDRLANLLIDRLVMLVNIVTKDPQILGVELMPEFLLLLDRLPFLDSRLLQAGREIKQVLGDPSWAVARRLRGLEAEAPASSKQEMDALSSLVEFDSPYDLKVIACISGDPLWIGLRDKWLYIPLDLRFQAAATLDRSWLSYRSLWCRSPADLRWVAVFMNDKRWLHNGLIWHNIPLQKRMKALCAKDPLLLNPENVDLIQAAIEESRKDVDCCCRAEVHGFVCTQCPLHCHVSMDPETHPEIVRLRNELKALISETMKERTSAEALSEQYRLQIEELSAKSTLLDSGLQDLSSRKYQIALEFEEFQRKLRNQRDGVMDEIQSRERRRLADIERLEADKRAEWEALRKQLQEELDSLRREELEALASERAKQLQEIEAKRSRELQSLKEAKEGQLADLERLKDEFVKQLEGDREKMERDVEALKAETERTLSASRQKLQEAEDEAQRKHAQAEDERAAKEAEILARQREAVESMKNAEEEARKRLEDARRLAEEALMAAKTDRVKTDAARIDILKESAELNRQQAADVSLESEKTPAQSPQQLEPPKPRAHGILGRIQESSHELIQPRPTADQMANVATTAGVVAGKATQETPKTALKKIKKPQGSQ